MATYRLFPLDHSDRIAAPPHFFVARDDQSALADARRRVPVGLRGEVWLASKLLGEVAGECRAEHGIAPLE